MFWGCPEGYARGLNHKTFKKRYLQPELCRYLFFECFGVVQKGMPEGSTTEETLKVMDHVAKLASKLRSDRQRDKITEKFGFSKTQVCS